MSQLSNIIKFYKDCYLNEYKAVRVMNFFGKNIEHQYYLNSFEPFNGKLLEYPVDSEWGKLIDEELTLNSMEKGLYAGAFFIKGSSSVLGRKTKIFAPLYLYEVELNLIDEVYSITLDLEDPIINPAFFDFAKAKYELDCTYDWFVEQFPKGPLGFDNLFLLKKQLLAVLPDLQVEAIEVFNMTDFVKNQLKSAYTSRVKYLDELIASIAVAMLPKPKGSRGVINELTALSQLSIKNRSFSSILLGSDSLRKKEKVIGREINVPVSLSHSQKQVFYSVDNHDTTLVIGPPGTGKSFTIAALTADLVSNGKSVLVASKNNQAGRVIANKIEKDLGLRGLVIKTANKGYKRSLKTKLKNILAGISLKKVDNVELAREEAVIVRIAKEITRLTKQLEERGQNEVEWGRFFYEYDDGFFKRLKRKWISYLHQKGPKLWEVKIKIDKLEKERVRKTKKFTVKKYNSLITKHLSGKREQVTALIRALEEEAGNLIHQEFDKIDFKTMLQALPAWICNTTDIHNVLPLKEALFDVVIIDEATQCDIASSIPLLYRAKKVVIVGDPKQLRHISFLSDAQEMTFKKKHNLKNSVLSYRKNSILDLLNNSIKHQDQVIFLNEHYRSAPDIIRFSNEKFYAGNLSVMTESPTLNTQKNIELVKVAGKRLENGVNELEALFIIEEIKKIVEVEANLAPKLRKRIGIISPFRAQVTYLKTAVKDAIGLVALKNHDVLIGTPFHFQGEERDFIFISFALDDDSHRGALNYLNREDVFNVSITRARNKQIVVTSLNYEKLGEQYLLGEYLNSIGHTDLNEVQEDIEDEFAEAVLAYIKERFEVDEVYTNFPIAGVDIDIVVVKEGKTYCFDLIGYPGPFEHHITPTMIEMLERMNHSVLFLSYTSWKLEQEVSEKLIVKFMASLHN